MNPKSLSNYYMKELNKIKTLFDNHSINANMVLSKLENYKDKDEIYSLSGTMVDVPLFICNSINEHRHFYTVKFTQQEEKNIIVKVAEVYNNLKVPSELKDNYKTAITSKLMNFLPKMLKDKEVNFNIEKMQYTVKSIDRDYVENLFNTEFTPNKIKPSKIAKKIDLEETITKLIRKSEIKSPKINVDTQNVRNIMDKKRHDSAVEFNENDIERYKRLQLKLIKMSEDISTPTVLRKMIKNNCKVTNKGLYIKFKDNSNYLNISMGGMSTESKAVAYRNTSQTFRDFISEKTPLILNLTGYSLMELKPILVTFINSSDLRVRLA